MYWVLYALLAIISLLLLFGVYIKLTMRFWSLQPVFHVYNLWYWLNPPGLIRSPLPKMNRYVNIVNIQMLNLATPDLTPTLPLLHSACAFIKDYYVQHPLTQYKPSVTNILAYLSNSNVPAYLAVHQTPSAVNSTPTLNAVVSARPLNITRLCKGRISETFVTYYIDNLCVAPGQRKQGLAPQMIQTMTYNLRHANKQIQTCMFKRERDLTAIVPLVTFKSDCYNITTEWLNRTDAVMPGGVTCIEIGVNQMSLFNYFIQENIKKFDWLVMPDLSNLSTLIKTENLFIYGLLQAGALIAIYVFRNTELFYLAPQGAAPQQGAPQRAAPQQDAALSDTKTIECIATISACPAVTFAAGLRAALRSIFARCPFGKMLLETTADATNLQVSLPPCQFSVPSAFYFYNYGCYTSAANKVLVIY